MAVCVKLQTIGFPSGTVSHSACQPSAVGSPSPVTRASPTGGGAPGRLSLIKFRFSPAPPFMLKNYALICPVASISRPDLYPNTPP